jgi:hypothetical protein
LTLAKGIDEFGENKPLNLGDITSGIGNMLTVATVGFPAGSIAGVVGSVAGATVNMAGLLDKHLPGGLVDVVATLNSEWRSALAPPRRDPLAIDLDGDGIETIGAAADGSMSVVFDHNADGLLTGTGWLTADDAWLVRDLDGNGLIDSGRELFGVDTRIDAITFIDGNDYSGIRNAFSGFEALAELDTGARLGTVGHRDRQFDDHHTALGEISLWHSLVAVADGNAGEQSTLADARFARRLGNDSRIVSLSAEPFGMVAIVVVAGVDRRRAKSLQSA